MVSFSQTHEEKGGKEKHKKNFFTVYSSVLAEY